MRKLYALILVSYILINCTNPLQEQEQEIPTGNVLITFQNVSNLNLNNMIVAGVQIGTIKTGRSSKAIGFDSFGFDTGMVDEDISFVVDGVKLNNHNRGFWCGTEKIRVESGQYIIKVGLSEYGALIYCENPPYISFE